MKKKSGCELKIAARKDDPDLPCATIITRVLCEFVVVLVVGDTLYLSVDQEFNFTFGVWM
jgi:hypothetical protein